MRALYNAMEEWQRINSRRLLSVSIEKDAGNYCCIALTNPTEVVITSADGRKHAGIWSCWDDDDDGVLKVTSQGRLAS